MPEFIEAVVARGGRPDLAETWLPMVEAPTELIVGSEDHHILEVNQRAIGHLECSCQLVEVPGASHLFPEPGAMETVASLARAWFERNMAPAQGWV
jgi:putative phosphoribosyl transferase